MTTSKYFISLTPEKFKKVIDLLGTDQENSITKIIETAPRSSINPLSDTEAANAVLFEGNILIEITK